MDLLEHLCVHNLKVSLNGKIIYNSNELQAYASYFYNLLLENRSKSEKEAAGFFPEGDSLTSSHSFDTRRSLFLDGATFQAITPFEAK